MSIDWITQFGKEYKVPQEIIDKYEDWSWHLNGSPQFLLAKKEKKEGHPTHYIALWVEHPNKKERIAEGLKRFEIVAYHVKDKGHNLFNSETYDDDFKQKIRIVQKYAEAHGIPHITDNGGINLSEPICSCGNKNMASMGTDIICDECHKYCGEVT